MNITSYEGFMDEIHKLYNHKNETLVYEYDPKTKQSTIYDEDIKNAITRWGIKIPHYIVKDNSSPFYGRSIVKIEDPDFYSAFRTVYFQDEMDKNTFKWEDS
jgi:hypothetical protein